MIIIPFALRNIFLEGEDLERLIRTTLAEDVEQVRLPGLQGPAGHLQVVVAEGNGLRLLPLVIKHVDGGLMVEWG